MFVCHSCGGIGSLVRVLVSFKVGGGGFKARGGGFKARVVDSRLEGVDSRLEGVDSRLEGVDSRLEEVDSRLEGVDSRSFWRCSLTRYIAEGKLKSDPMVLGALDYLAK
eukprot:248846-Prorocentrum_minimum.AAC.1